MTLSALVWLVEEAWPALVIAGALGVGVGFATASPRPTPARGWMTVVVFLLVLAGAAAAAWLAVVPGRAGLWLETALLLVAPYLAGCGLGGLLGLTRRGRTGASPAA